MPYSCGAQRSACFTKEEIHIETVCRGTKYNAGSWLCSELGDELEHEGSASALIAVHSGVEEDEVGPHIIVLVHEATTCSGLTSFRARIL